jgi:hypothetical protein
LRAERDSCEYLLPRKAFLAAARMAEPLLRSESGPLAHARDAAL